MNSRLVKRDGKLVEEVYKVGGYYSAAIEKIVENLRKAVAFAENDKQKAHINKLIQYYTDGNLKTFDEYSILWVEDVVSSVDFINGFIENYGDPLGYKGAWESIVNFKTRRLHTAQRWSAATLSGLRATLLSIHVSKREGERCDGKGYHGCHPCR